jgi:hypothetical protein
MFDFFKDADSSSEYAASNDRINEFWNGNDTEEIGRGLIQCDATRGPRTDFCNPQWIIHNTYLHINNSINTNSRRDRIVNKLIKYYT